VLSSAPSIQSGNPRDIEQLFDAAQYSTEDLTEYYMWLDSNGSIVSASNIARASHQYNSMWNSEIPPFLKEPQKTANIFYSNMIRSPVDNADRFYISYPILYSLKQDQQSSGEFRGVIAASIRMDTLGGILTNELSPTLESDVSLADTTGNMVYSIDKSVLGKNIFENPVYLTTPLFKDLTSESKAELIDFLEFANSQQQTETASISLSGKTVTITSHPISQKGNHFWTLYITAPHVFTDNIDSLLAMQDAVTIFTLTLIGAVSLGLAYLVLSWNKKLETTVKARTFELNISNDSLIKTNAQLAEANEQLKVHANLQREFVNIAAHELRTPIMPILGVTDLLESKFNHAENNEIVLRKDDFEILSRNSRRLERLATDILDVSRIDTQALHLNIESFDLYEVIERVIADTSNQFPNDKVKYVLEAEKGLLISADKSKMTQAISNLLNNSAKFTDEGQIKVTCTAQASGVAGPKISLTVSDTGTGIEPSMMPRLFTKFATRPGSDRNQVGSGLGLYVAKGIIEAHGGSIRAYNNGSGRGCTFSVSIPASTPLLKKQ
jgi:signal transduction histidine kinase